MPTPLGMFTNTAVVNARTWLTESNGSAVLSATLDGSSFACSIQPQSSSEGIGKGRDESTKRAVMYYPSSITLTATDTVTAGGVVWRVVGPPRDVAGRATFFEVDLEQEVG